MQPRLTDPQKNVLVAPASGHHRDCLSRTIKETLVLRATGINNPSRSFLILMLRAKRSIRTGWSCRLRGPPAAVLICDIASFSVDPELRIRDCRCLSFQPSIEPIYSRRLFHSFAFCCSSRRRGMRETQDFAEILCVPC